MSFPCSLSNLFYALIKIPDASGRTMISAAPIIVPPPKIAILFMTLGGALINEGKYPQIKVPTKSKKKTMNALLMSDSIMFVLLITFIYLNIFTQWGFGVLGFWGFGFRVRV